MTIFNSIVAVHLLGDHKAGIGLYRDGKYSIPWHSKEDLKYFREKTTGQVVIMGRHTQESIGRYLPNRTNIIITRGARDYIEESDGNTKVIYVESPYNAIKWCNDNKIESAYVIGGATIYEWFHSRNLVSKAYMTFVNADFPIETNIFYPSFMNGKKKYINSVKDGEYDLTFIEYTYENEEEINFLNLMSRILTEGHKRMDRTGTGTIAIFGNQLKFNLQHFPLLTTRKLFFKGIFEELMFYIRGETDNDILRRKGANIWTSFTTREYLDSKGLNHLPEGDMGPTYGFLFRHFGAEYKTCKDDYTGQGFDQLSNVMRLLVENPSDRRMIIDLWDPKNVDKCALPPCLYNYQFFVDSNNRLHCMMTQRSSDYMIAGGWNVATGALLTMLLCRMCDKIPGTLTWNIGDTHIYNNLVSKVKEQLTRTPFQFPILRVLVKRPDISQYTLEDVELLNYDYHSPIKNLEVSL